MNPRSILKRLKNANKPEGIFSLSYFSRKPNATVAFHRALFFLSCDRPWWLFIKLFAYSRWLSYGVWRQSYRFSKTIPAVQLEQNGLSRAKLFKELIYYGVFYSLMPYEYVRHQLYKPSHKKRALNIIYDHEQPHFHRHNNRFFTGFEATVTLINDKHQFALALMPLGLPTVNGICYTPYFRRKQSFVNQTQALKARMRFCLIMMKKVTAIAFNLCMAPC